MPSMAAIADRSSTARSMCTASPRTKGDELVPGHGHPVVLQRGELYVHSRQGGCPRQRLAGEVLHRPALGCRTLREAVEHVGLQILYREDAHGAMMHTGCVYASREEAWPSVASCSRSAKRWILPVAVFGSDVDDDQPLGRLNAAIRARQWASIAAGSIDRSARGTTNATVISRPASSRAPTTAASSTSGCSISTDSTSAGDTQMPPALIMSLLRPRNVQ